MDLTEIFNNVYLFKDSVNVYAIRSGNKAVLIDFGSGVILNHLSNIGVDKVDYVFHTHYHRDQCYGDNKALKQNIKIAAPDKEKKLFVEAEKFWKTKSYYDIYSFKPTFFVSTYNIPLELTFKDGDFFDWEQYRFNMIETSGHTTGSNSYLIEINGKKLAFVGDLIHSGAKVITYYDLQYYYNDNGDGGITRSLESFEKLLKSNPEILLPSHGDLIQSPKKEIKELENKFERARTVFCTRTASILDMPQQQEQIIDQGMDPVKLKEVFPHIVHRGFNPPFFILGSQHSCMLIDFAGSAFFGYKESQLKRIFKKFDIEKIDLIIPTHYHDDHTAGIPFLQQKYNIKVYALQEMVDVLENPTHYRIGCLIDTPIKVDRVLKDGEFFEWDDYKFQVFHFPGQTEYHMGLFGEIDGKSVFFTGDSLASRVLVDRFNNVNCINFCRLGKNVGYMKCAEILLKCKPEYIAISHQGIFKVEKDLLTKFKEFVSEYEPVINDLVAQENPNMGFDPNWICFKPIRVITKPGNEFKTNLVVRNYLNKKSTIEFELNLPDKWDADFEKNSLIIEPNSFKKIPISIKIPHNKDSNGRTIITANIKWNGTDLGPFPDLMVDHGYIPQDTWDAWRPGKKPDLFGWIFRHIQRDLKFFK